MFKKHKKLLLQILFLVLLPLIFLIPLINGHFIETHDALAQVARFAAYITALNDGQLLPRWAGNLNYGYGSAVLIFYYPFPGWISILLHAVGFNLETAFKLIIGASFIGCFVSFFLWIRELTKNDFAAIVGALIYGFAPYHFLNLYVRGDVAELMALAVAPLVFLFLEKIFKTKDIKYAVIGGVIYGLLIISHNSVSLVFSAVILLYSILRAGVVKNFKKEKKTFALCLILIFLGLGMAAFFWFPAIMESKYTNIKLFVGEMYKENFPAITSLIYSPWGFGPEVNKSGGLSPQLGIVTVSGVLLAAFFAFKKNKYKKEIIFWLISLIILIFLTLSQSDIVWKYAPLLKQFQFPWRLVGIESFAAAALISLYLALVNNKMKLLLLIAVILYSIQFVKVHTINSKSDSFYFTYPGTTYYHGQASSIWTEGDFYKYPKKRVELIGGKGTIKVVSFNTNKHVLETNGENALSILDNTSYFPGWVVKVDNQAVPVQFQDMNHRGLLEFSVPAGKHKVVAEFTESKVRLLADIISGFAILFAGVLIILRKKINKLKI